MRTIFTLIPLLILTACDGPLSPEGKSLAEAIKNADRIVIFHNQSEIGRATDASTSKQTVRALRSHQGVAEGFQCLCYADYVITWYREKTVQCSIGFQPDLSISWPDGPLGGDVQLNEESAQLLYTQIQAAFAAGNLQEGYKPPIPE